MRRVSVVIGVLVLLLVAQQAFGAMISGAIFTGLEDGAAVNKNLYDEKCDVYLIGGPGPNAPPTASGLPAGEYYFQVTDPSGKVLLSTDAIEDRMFEVGADGYIIGLGSTGTHNTGIDTTRGYGVTIQLCPYDDTPNKGGVYKVWATPVAWYTPGEGFHGFIPAYCKTDNYKVKKGRQYPPVITVRKFNDTNGNGTWDSEEPEITGWAVDVIEPEMSAPTQTVYTPAEITAYPGTWTLIEDTPCDWLQTALIVDGVSAPVSPTASVVVTGTNGNKETHEVIYGNLELAAAEAWKFYDRNRNGEWDADEPPVPGWKITLQGTDIFGTFHDLVGYTDADGHVRFGFAAGYCGMPPGEYTLAEELPANSGWEPSTALSIGPVTVPAGGSISYEFGNYCTATADFDTKGYWHNKNGLSELTQADIDDVNVLDPYDDPTTYFDDGDEPFDGYFGDGTPVEPAIGDGIWQGEEIAPVGTPKAEVSQFLVDQNAGGDPREQLAQQLLAFIFNAQHRLDSPGGTIQLPDGTWISAADLIDQAIGIWQGGDAEAQNAMASLLDALNNSDAVPFIPYLPCPVQY